MLLFGKPVSETVKLNLKTIIKKNNLKPILVIIQIGDNSASNLYIKKKIDFAQEIDVLVILKKFPHDCSYFDVLSYIEKCNNDVLVNGIILQLPIENEFKDLIHSISYEKDVDGLSFVQQSNLIVPNAKDCVFYPCTAKAVMKLLEHYNIAVDNKNCVIFGRSNLVGKPLAMLLLNANAAVTIVHSKIKNVESYIKNADILFLATGMQNLIGRENLKKDQIVIDIGINLNNGKLCGDLNKDAYDFLETYTPVPGGIGVITVAALMENVVQAALNQKKK